MVKLLEIDWLKLEGAVLDIAVRDRFTCMLRYLEKQKGFPKCLHIDTNDTLALGKKSVLKTPIEYFKFSLSYEIVFLIKTTMMILLCTIQLLLLQPSTSHQI